MNESQILKRVQYSVGSRHDFRVFRNQVGVGFIGQKPNLTRVSMGLCPGSGDLIGWKIYRITASDVGKNVAVFSSIEVKSESGKLGPNQIVWLRAVQQSGGIAAVVRSEEEAINAIELWKPTV